MLRAGSIVVLAVAACAEDRIGDPPWRDAPLGTPQPLVEVPAPLPAAHCSIIVEGIGEIELEDDYLPHVIRCENGGAGPEALKAQAIAARSVAYYNIETQGSICDGTGCQVYSCDAAPGAEHYAAVAATSGVYTHFNDTLTYAFFVAGDAGVGGPACVGMEGATEKWVTYNEGKTGDAVEQTALGSVFDPTDAGYGQNRGCMGQWSARCLEAERGYDATAIMQFFYGMDIGLLQAEGPCVLPLGSESGTSAADDTGPTATATGDSGDATTSSSGTGTSDGRGTEPLDDGTSPALPDGFGEMRGSGQGCGCRQGASWGTGPLVLGCWLARRRRRAHAVAG